MGARPVLIVDDDEAIRFSLQSTLELQGYRTFLAADGQKALDFLIRNETPGLILLDMMMPLMNGWELAEALTHNPHWVDIPVVVITAFPERLGTFPLARATLHKPIDCDRLFSLVELFCGKA